MSKSAMIQNQIFSLGTCAKLALHFDDRVFSVLCTVWPDSSDCLSGEECSIDDSVCFGLDSPFWTECRCEVSVVVLENYWHTEQSARYIVTNRRFSH